MRMMGTTISAAVVFILTAGGYSRAQEPSGHTLILTERVEVGMLELAVRPASPRPWIHRFDNGRASAPRRSSGT